jgi:uncharacterized YccA/Bax inhibitor family protein
MRGSNPALNDNSFDATIDGEGVYNDIMTLEGTVSKSLFLIALVIIAGFAGWKICSIPSLSAQLNTILIGASVLGFITAMITIFKKSMAPTTAPAYAIFEGVTLGIFSYLYENMYSGIVLQAVFLTISVFVGLLFCYKSGLIKATENFKLGIISATFGIFVVYLISFIGHFVGFEVPYIHESGPIGIGVSIIIVIVAALNLVLDFDFIEKGSERGDLPSYMEWYGAFGLLVTLVWLYIEILRLLAKLRDRD